MGKSWQVFSLRDNDGNHLAHPARRGQGQGGEQIRLWQEAPESFRVEGALWPMCRWAAPGNGLGGADGLGDCGPRPCPAPERQASGPFSRNEG